MTIRDDVTIQKDSLSLKTVQLETTLGPAELSWNGEKLARFAWLPKRAKRKSGLVAADLTDTQRDLIQDVVDYAAGIRIDFAKVPTDLSHGTPFQQKIWEACQRIPYGEVVTYGELARLAGRPGAARAVGTAMSQNRIPLIIPCHRVISAGNKIGGFTSPQGISLKKRLLDLEAGSPTDFKMPQKSNFGKMPK
ncbi:cysteine methyltransferase [Blastopirellula marina]|uniref:methylated-DNA--[protein]-cysteine S-methyltransferase n=1 Tax=Blastopirellula marina TaxID=124 RepID=A0A2S8FT88_9BACT|nr:MULTISPECIES: methylated-DNA--[protein]-cysteine S-methyltransferase [Pirellulaceae]PQO35270.1 cysteine methyltransferase [Blastopirellula marina]RCS53139.1 methylated-DNA--[protein]-cysteine S-methyltransferase [Bremerella cremea]